MKEDILFIIEEFEDGSINAYQLVKKIHHTQRWKEYSNGVTSDKSKDIILYQALSLKWYEEFKDVQEINSFIKMGEEDDRCIVCVGEDDVVHSDIGDYWDVFNIYMKVELT